MRRRNQPVRGSAVLLIALLCSGICRADEPSGHWWRPYRGADVDNSRVLGFWRFDGAGEAFAQDASSYKHLATVRGATWAPDGRYGGCLESGAGFPVSDTSHAIHVAASPRLSPARAFTVEMWIRPRNDEEFPDSLSPVLIDSKYVPSDHAGMMWFLTRSTGGRRQMGVHLGLGTHSDTWYSTPIRLVPGKWHHVAFAYDAMGRVDFFLDGSAVGSVRRAGAGPVAVSRRPLAIGDRLGSNHRGFPGSIDEVRIVEGRIDFRPLRVEFARGMRTVMRDARTPRFDFVSIVDQTEGMIDRVTAHWSVRGMPESDRIDCPMQQGRANLIVSVDTLLRPGKYETVMQVSIAEGPAALKQCRFTASIPFTIMPRPLPHRMPVVMWGIGGTENVVREIPRLREIGFTHCLGLNVNYGAIWKRIHNNSPPARTNAELLQLASIEQIEKGRRMLDAAAAADLKIIASLSPGHWLRTAPGAEKYRRVDRDGKPYARHDVSGAFEKVQRFCYDTGYIMGKAYGGHPAFAGALIHSEVRGASQVSFHPIERAAFRRATGLEIPAAVKNKRGVDYRKLNNFPEDRVVPDDDPILRFYRWFWKDGDGWNLLHSKVDEGLKQGSPRAGLWTFHDPAVRVPSIGGSGGSVDVLSHWTYSYPDPIRIGMCTDELLEMARVNARKQRVMKMTQIIWYRSQTAPLGARKTTTQSPWVDRDPDAAYITIAPMHLREAFWWKIARPIRGIMYHGWQSLVPTDSRSAYRLTNSNTKDELKRLIAQVVRPLGPTLMQIPDAPSDVAFLESFTSQMYAGRGTYGWNHTWAGDVYHILMYARLQPRVMYEESLLAGGLQGIRVLVMPDCDVLHRSVVRIVRRFQAAGGIVIGDKELCPAIEPDYVIERFSRTKKAEADRRKLLHTAAALRAWLEPRYQWRLDSTNPDVVVRRRRFGSTDYIFAVNDRRAYGTYVGGYGLVMEDGLPSTTTVILQSTSRHIYDLLEGKEIAVERNDDTARIPCSLGPCEGRLWMATERPIREVSIRMPNGARQGNAIAIDIEITDGERPIDAVVPLVVRIVDPEGVPAEFSGYYGATGGRLRIPFEFAPNDRTGVWQVSVRELASRRLGTATIRLDPVE